MNILKGLFYGIDIIELKKSKDNQINSFERLINICNTNKIEVWNCLFDNKYSDRDRFRIIIYHYDLNKLEQISKKCGLVYNIIEQKGIRALFIKTIANYNYVVGVFCIIGTILLLNCFVWDITYDENYKYTDSTLGKILKQNGVIVGQLKNKIDCFELEYNIRNQHSDISFVSAYIDGCVLKMTIKEGIVYQGKSEENDCKSIVASADGIITNIITRNGTPAVKVGDEIKKGDVLVYGSYQIKDDSDTVIETKEVRADADISMRICKKIKFSFPMEYQEYFYTDNVKKGIYLITNHNKKMLYKPFKLYDLCDIMNCDLQSGRLGTFLKIPHVGVTYYFECEKENLVHNEESATRKAKELIEDYVAKLGENNIGVNSYDYKFVFENDNVIVEVNFVLTGSFFEWADAKLEE